VLLAELVFFGVGRRIAAQPELFDELLAFFVGGESLEGVALLITDDPDDFFVSSTSYRESRAPCAACLPVFSFACPSSAWRRFALGRRSLLIVGQGCSWLKRNE